MSPRLKKAIGGFTHDHWIKAGFTLVALIGYLASEVYAFHKTRLAELEAGAARRDRALFDLAERVSVIETVLGSRK